MLGVRIDVRQLGAATWTSLMEREARYLVGGEAVAELREEGHLKLGAAVRQDDGTLAADEIVARWDGWSLAVGARLGTGGRRTRPDRAIDFDWAFEVPAGSLLPLRFSSDYHLRARVADLAGGGVGRDDDDVVVQTALIPYRRLEPVSAPTMAAVLGDLGPGGTADVLVIRADAPEYPPNFERMMSAPLTTLDVAEQHGMLDGNDEATFDRVRRAMASGLPDPAADGMTLFVVPEPAGVDARPVQVGWRGDWPDAGPQRIELVPRVDADQPVIEPDPSDDVVRVILAPTEQVTIEVSSFLRQDFPDHFALRRWRLAGDGDEPVAVGDDIVRLGRHPMATPARRLTFIHAVRRPSNEPQGTLVPAQTAGGMSAVLTPSTPLFGLDPASTADVQIAAVVGPPRRRCRRPPRPRRVAARAHRPGRCRPRRDGGPALRRHPPPSRDLLDHRRQSVPTPVPQRRGRRAVPGARRQPCGQHQEHRAATTPGRAVGGPGVPLVDVLAARCRSPYPQRWDPARRAGRPLVPHRCGRAVGRPRGALRGGSRPDLEHADARPVARGRVVHRGLDRRHCVRRWRRRHARRIRPRVRRRVVGCRRRAGGAGGDLVPAVRPAGSRAGTSARVSPVWTSR